MGYPNMFSFNRACWAVLHCVCANVLPANSVRLSCLTPHHWSRLELSLFSSHSAGTQQCLTVVLVCISLMTDKMEQPFLCLVGYLDLYFFCKMSGHVFCPLNNMGSLSFSAWLLGVLEVFWTWVLYWLHTMQMSFPSRIILHFLN